VYQVSFLISQPNVDVFWFQSCECHCLSGALC
jgi:hypothetical protein